MQVFLHIVEFVAVVAAFLFTPYLAGYVVYRIFGEPDDAPMMWFTGMVLFVVIAVFVCGATELVSR